VEKILDTGNDDEEAVNDPTQREIQPASSLEGDLLNEKAKA
jgi:hypothetical protein